MNEILSIFLFALAITAIAVIIGTCFNLGVHYGTEPFNRKKNTIGHFLIAVGIFIVIFLCLIIKQYGGKS